MELLWHLWGSPFWPEIQLIGESGVKSCTKLTQTGEGFYSPRTPAQHLSSPLEIWRVAHKETAELFLLIVPAVWLGIILLYNRASGREL